MAIIHLDVPMGNIQVQIVQVVNKTAKRDPLFPIQIDPIASIIKIPTDAAIQQTDPAYHELVCTEEDQQKIQHIITTIAENGKLSLLFKSSELKRLGAEINHVHPLKFLSTIFSNNQLKAYINEIYGDYFKWSGFMDGLVPSLTTHADRNKLEQYLAPFALEVGASADLIRSYIDARDWDGLVRYLMSM